jgi:hypothetical protein
MHFGLAAGDMPAMERLAVKNGGCKVLGLLLRKTRGDAKKQN